MNFGGGRSAAGRQSSESDRECFGGGAVTAAFGQRSFQGDRLRE